MYLEQHKTIPKITTKGKIRLIKLGNRNNDKRNIVMISTCSKFVKENNLVIWSSHEIEIKIKKTSVQALNIWINT